jgi:hypothetical protein
MNLQSGIKLDTANFLGSLKGINEIHFLDKEINVIGRGKSCNVIINVRIILFLIFQIISIFSNFFKIS